MRRTKFRLATGIAGLAALAACQTTPPSGPAAPAPIAQMASAAGEGSERVCRRVTPIGSNLPQRICASAAEWAARDKAGQEQTEEFNRAARGATSPTIPPR